MNDFSKLNRDEMRKITGGVPPVCNVDSMCFMADPSLPGNPVLYGNCEQVMNDGCQCVRRGVDGDLNYGHPAQCMS